ncbi:MAG: response regulator, partial [Bdellovibrionales bacterium]|nr:response regulator [Bdellovibrionales bacterium]
MSQVLVIEDNPSLRGILKLNSIKLLGADVIEKETVADAVSFIQILPGIDLIICREKMHGSFELITALMSAKLSIPLIWIGQKQPLYKSISMLPVDSTWEKVLDEAGKILKVEVKNKINEEDSG